MTTTNADVDETTYSQPLAEPWKSASRLRQLYVEEGLTQAEIADQFDIDQSTVWYWMNQLNVERGGGR